MRQKITWSEKINIANIFVTLLLSIASLGISYNSYKISVNTFNTNEKLNSLIDKQSEFELYTSVGTLVTISSMLNHNESENPNISNSLKAFNEIKSTLQSQLKNGSLIKNVHLASMWSAVLGDTEYKIKVFEIGLKPNTIIKGGKEMIIETEIKCNELYTEYRRIYQVELLPTK